LPCAPCCQPDRVRLAKLNSAADRGRAGQRRQRFAVRAEPLAETARWINVLAPKWDQRLAAIRRIAEMQ
jgi:hypothetical protein